MVVLSGVKNMFWGVTLDGGKRYSQTVEHSFHISMAAVEVKAESGGGDKKHQGNVAVMIQHDKAEFLLCTLSEKIPQTALDLNFSEGEDVTFFLNGKGVVHLTGYLLDDSAFDNDLPDEGLLMDEEESDEEDTDDDSDDDDEAEEDEVEAPNLLGSTLDDEDSEDDEDFDPMSPSKPNKKRKKETLCGLVGSPAKKSKAMTIFADMEAEEDSDDDDGSFAMGDLDADSDDDLEFEEEDSDDELDSDDEEEMSDEDDESDDELPKVNEEKKTPKSAKILAKESPKSEKAKNKTKGKGDTPENKKENTPKTKPEGAVQNGASPTSSKKKKKNKDGTPQVKAEVQTPGKKGEKKTPAKTKEEVETPKSKKKQKSEETPGKQAKKTMAGGTVVEVLSEGHGPEAKTNKMVSMYYRGTLKQNGKLFDECMKGKPFKFKLGKGEVIKGWDTAIQGMKVGGKRKITVPPSQGYGNQRVGPIPPGSTLIFEIELKAVS